MSDARPRRILTKAVCLGIISPILIALLAFLVLAAFWWTGDDGLASARGNGEALKARLIMGPDIIQAGEIAAAVALPARTCVCISTPYANPGSSFVVGNNDISGSFGSELIDESISAVLAFDPDAQAAVARAVIRHGRIDFSLSLADVPKSISGVWCGPSSSVGSVAAEGDRLVVTFNAVRLSTNACRITATE